MVVGDVLQTTTESVHDYVPSSHHSTTSSDSSFTQSAVSTPTQSTASGDAGVHVRFRGSTPQQNAPQQPAQQAQETVTNHGAPPPPSPRLEPTHRSAVSLNGSLANSPSRIKVRDLSHIQSFASEEVLTRSRHPSRHSLRGRMDGGQQYEISAMPVTDIIEMVAGLLTKITTQNDKHHEDLHPNIPPPDGISGLSQQATSVLAFHGKNVPSITIASYLSRIHKYCPTTYEVFLSLLVYFDRMTEMVNSGSDVNPPRDEQGGNSVRPASSHNGSATATASVATTRSLSPMASPPSSASSMDISMDSGDDNPFAMSESEAFELSQCFVVDSFNIHRLIMAGVTCASKFFSDVFYTNSRYAKVGGLPLVELNHLELQFLLLNDFRLSIPISELNEYGNMLVEFYASEIMSQQQHQQGHHANEGLYMHTPTQT